MLRPWMSICGAGLIATLGLTAMPDHAAAQTVFSSGAAGSSTSSNGFVNPRFNNSLNSQFVNPGMGLFNTPVNRGMFSNSPRNLFNSPIDPTMTTFNPAFPRSDLFGDFRRRWNAPMGNADWGWGLPYAPNTFGPNGQFVPQ